MQVLGGIYGETASSSRLELPVPVLARCFDTTGIGFKVRSEGRKRRGWLRVRAQVNSDERENAGSWNERFGAALRNGAARYYRELVQELKSEAGVDVEKLQAGYRLAVERGKQVGEKAVTTGRDVKKSLAAARDEGSELVSDFRLKTWPRVVAWHQWERWKWDAQHIGAFVLYVLLIFGSLRGVYMAATTPRISKRAAKQFAEAYLEATVPEPTAETVRKLEKLEWRENFPKGFRVRKHVLGPDGVYRHDPTFIGEHAWDDDDETSQASAIVSPNDGTKQKLPWKERLAKLDKLLEEDASKEDQDALTSKYVVLYDTKELEEKIIKEREQEEQEQGTSPFGIGYWTARRWWKYRPKISYLDFLDKITNMEVRSAVFSPDRTTVYATMKDGFPSEYMVDVPADPYLDETLERSQVEVDTIPQSKILSFLRAYVILLPCVFLVFMLDKVLLKTRQNAGEMIVDLERMNSLNLILPYQAEEAGFPTFNDVIVSKKVWSVVEEIGNFMSDPMRYYEKGCLLPRGILIHGPPGTGKTHIARAMARQLKLPFIYASGSEFGDSEVPGPAKIFDLFFTARANAPAIVFIDEIDALAGKHVEDDQKRLRTFEQLLKELDGGLIDTEVYRFAPRQAFILICATNRRDELHEAFLQRQRIDRELHIGLPNEEERLRIFKVHAADHQLAEDVDFGKVVYRTRGFSGADLKNFAKQTFVNAKQNGRSVVAQSDLVEVLDKQLFEGIGMTITEDEQRASELRTAPEKKRLLAVHEAGHVLLAHLFPRFDWHAFTHLLPGGKERPMSVFYPSEEMLDNGGTIGYFKAQMVVAHGGRLAERLLFHEDVTDGWRDDIAKISALARECAINTRNPKIGLLQVARIPLPKHPRPQPKQLYPMTWNHPRSEVIPMSMEVSELVAREIQRYIDDTEKMASDAVLQNRHILERLADELEQRIKISGDEVKEIVMSMEPVMLPDIAGPVRYRLRTEEPTPEETRRMMTQGDYDDLDIYPAPLHRC